MDNIAFYTENKEEFNKILPLLPFDRQRLDKIIVEDNEKLLYLRLKNKHDVLLFYMKRSIEVSDKVVFNTLGSRIEGLKITVVTHKNFALPAWQHNLFDFKEFPFTSKNIIESYFKYLRGFGKVRNYIPEKTREGNVKLPFKNICYIKADGNFSHIYMDNGSSYMITKQLNKYEVYTAIYPYLHKMNRSWILNLAKIKKLTKESTLHFYGDVPAIKLSKASRAIVRRLIF